MKDEDNADKYESMDSESDGFGSDDDDDAVLRQLGDDVSFDDEEAPLMDAAFIDCLGGSLSIKDMNRNTLRSMAWTPASSKYETDNNALEGLRDQVARPVQATRAKKDSPFELLFYFMPTSLWTFITRETNTYKRSHLEEKARRERPRLIREGRNAPGQTLRDVRRRIRVEPDYVPREVLRVMGLLVAHMLSPTPNKRDKLWKLKAVIDVLQARFFSALTVSNIILFDEGVLPATSKRHGTRMFMLDKPHRYDTNMFMTCDVVSAYYHSYDLRFEIYVWKRQINENASQAFGHKTRAAAILHVGPAHHPTTLHVRLHGWDNYDVEAGARRAHRRATEDTASHSRAWFIQVLKIGCNAHHGCKPLMLPQAGALPDHRSVHGRRCHQAKSQGGGAIDVQLPILVMDYQRWVGGVDVHDELRLQTFSVQTAFRFRKYYTGMFLGMYDLALVNAYLTPNEACRLDGVAAMKRVS
ncbi:hypothetical protein L916_12688 [Phytophthora nicotianae]|uniref:PiggyBac transposable element-derived protein domain-containing protein n=1 Tax=Phytophthora nicotianae TaxID=4792 RepID=W2IP62_PHYNI|nr:hypothetical protein L916_12688 [Phytophthora nicotianae]